MSLTLITGPMFAGKTTELLRFVRRSSIAQRRVALVKYEKDTRYDSANVVSHDYMRVADDGVRTFVTLSLSDIVGDLGAGFDVVAIDEGQFYSDLVPVCAQLSGIGVKVIVSALNGKFDQTPFETVSGLLPYVTKIVLLNAVCMTCGADAPFTIRMTDSSEAEIIGGRELYRPVCRNCLRAQKGQ